MNDTINDINDINTDIEEGKLLLASISKLSSESQSSKTPNQILGQLNKLSDVMF